MLVVDGERTFIIGLYENPAEDAVLDAAAKAGFNLVHASADAAALDRLSARNLWAWINTGASIDFSENPSAREEELRRMMAEFGEHPALLVWEVPDEALWNCFYGATMWRRSQEPAQLRTAIDVLSDAALQTELREMMASSSDLWNNGLYAQAEETANAIWRKLGQEPPNPGLNLSNAPERAAKMCAGMIQGYELLKKADPNHPVWMNHAPRNQVNQLAAFNRAADIVGCDIYPVPAFKTGHSDRRQGEPVPAVPRVDNARTRVGLDRPEDLPGPGAGARLRGFLRVSEAICAAPARGPSRPSVPRGVPPGRRSAGGLLPGCAYPGEGDGEKMAAACSAGHVELLP